MENLYSETFKEITLFAPAISAICFVISVIIATISASIAYKSLNRSKQLQKETLARNVYSEYLKLAIQHPTLAYPPSYIDRFNFDGKTLNGSVAEFEKYEWYVSFMLFSMREILEISHKDMYWNAIATRQIKYHIDYIYWRYKAKTPKFHNITDDGRGNYDFIDTSSKQVKNIIKKLVKEKY